MINNTTLLNTINSSVRSIKAKVESYNGSTLVATYNHNDALISIQVERAGEEKFFGFGFCQKINVKLRDVDRTIDISTANTLKIYFGEEQNYLSPLPLFKVSEVHRDETTNQLSITAYDCLYAAAAHKTGEIELISYTIGEYAAACAALIGATGTATININDESFNMSYPEGANLEGTETIREVLNDIAEATQSVYYLDSNNTLVFKRLDKDGSPVFTIDKSKYFTLDSSTNRRLGVICHATELGDNVSAELMESGSTQFVRDNPFWDLREDIDVIVDNALAAVGGLTINQFDCSWRGNFLLEVGDKIALTTKDDKEVYSYILNDTLEYNGSFQQKTSWHFADDDTETASNPSTLGEVIKQTYAKVDKANKQIDIVASEIEANSSAIGSLQINTESISSSVSKMIETTEDKLEQVDSFINEFNTNIEQTAENVKIAVKQEIDTEGVSKVITETGFTFDDTGLTVAKEGSNLTTTITEDGMTVQLDNTPVLTANNTGVDAMNLHATTYLFIGQNSRFQDYNNGARTGCFWIGR